MKAIYTRISEDDDSTALGVKRQLQDCQALAQLKSWSPSDIKLYTDNDHSAYTGAPRPAYLQLLNDISAGLIDGLIGYNFDRIWRLPKELEAFLELSSAHNLTHVYTVEGDINLSTHDGQFQARILCAVAKKSSDDTSRRQKRKHVELAERGLPSGPMGYGYNQDLTVNEDEALIIKEAVSHVLDGISLHAIANSLNARSLFTRRGNKWSATALRYVVTSGRIAGIREKAVRNRTIHNQGIEVGPAAWPPIVSADDLARVRNILLLPERHQPARERRYYLTGLLICGKCGNKLGTRPYYSTNGQQIRRYFCVKEKGGCNGLGINAKAAEEFVLKLIVKRLDSPAFDRACKKKSKHDPNLAKSIEADEARLARLARHHFVDDGISEDEYLAARAPIAARLDSNRKKLQATRIQHPEVGDDYPAGQGLRLYKDWPNLSVERQSSIARKLIHHITVSPQTRGPVLDLTRLGDVAWT